MHRREPSITVPLPSLDAGLVSNLIALAALAAFCVILSLVTFWWVGAMLGCVFTFGCVVWYQRSVMVEETPANANVRALKKSAA